MRDRNIDEGKAYLESYGFGLFSIVAYGAIPGDFIDGIEQAHPGSKRFRSLIFIANAGKRMWEAIAESNPDPEDPIDTFTRRITGNFTARFLAGAETVTLFPSPERRFPVQKFGEWIGWVHPSPVGVGIHAEYGLWHAYRSALLTTMELDETPRIASPSPCDSCEEKPCISLCPAGAVKGSVHRMDTFDVKSCAEFRLGEDSVCHDKCLSRLSCPVGKEHKYPIAQMNHAYSKSLPRMAAYLERVSGGSPDKNR